MGKNKRELKVSVPHWNKYKEPKICIIQILGFNHRFWHMRDCLVKGKMQLHFCEILLCFWLYVCYWTYFRLTTLAAEMITLFLRPVPFSRNLIQALFLNYLHQSFYTTWYFLKGVLKRLAFCLYTPTHYNNFSDCFNGILSILLAVTREKGGWMSQIAD